MAEATPEVKKNLVEFTKDVYPYCKGDVVELDEAEQARVDKIVASRDDGRAYKKFASK